jgi:hypothetical protein
VPASVKIQSIEMDDIQTSLHEDSSSTIGTQELHDFLKRLVFDEQSI